MSGPRLPSLEGLSGSDARRLERICTRFEAAWKQAPPRPRLAEFVPSENDPIASKSPCAIWQ